MATFTWDVPVVAPPETVWEVLTDHRGYADITAIRRVEILEPGDPAPNGLGAVRALHALGPPLRERIIEWEPPARFAYELFDGAPVRDHVGTVTLEPGPGGTRMLYVLDTFPAAPVVGQIAVRVARFAVDNLVKGIVKGSEQRASANR